MMNQIKALSLQHNLFLIFNKSSTLVYGSKSSIAAVKNNPNIEIDYQAIPVVDSVKNLGVIIEGDLRFRSHLRYKLLYVSHRYLNFYLRKHVA